MSTPRDVKGASMNFDEAMAFVARWEGGWSDHPDDSGGKTKYGITEGTWARWKKAGYPGPDRVEDLYKSDARNVYRSWYWEAVKADSLPPALRLAVFDAAVNQGPKRAIKFLQAALGTKTDGIIGPITLSQAEKRDDEATLLDFYARRAVHYSSLKSIAIFWRGWFRRLFDGYAASITVLMKETTG